MNYPFFRYKILLLGFFVLIYACSPQKTTKQKSSTTKSSTTQKPDISAKNTTKNDETIKLNLPKINREFRGAWIATVANINWPSKNNLTTEQQKAEAIKILDVLKEANFNAVIYQARPSADALYKSSYEPWSSFLTGETGKSPSPYYDPLEFWIAESHKRGMELHVWLNPYRAHHSSGGTINKESMVKKMPDEIVKLRNGTYWMDPSNEKTQNHASNVVKDLVKRYDIDGIHFDDYFYPYASYNGGKDFPDDKTWSVYKKSGGTLSRADWRRANVNKFIKRIYDEIKQTKSEVKFGISPFGIWKPGFPKDVKGSSQYDELFADAKLWLNNGWIDYFAPQLYWPINSSGQNFNSLLKWWQSENTMNRHLWPGLNTVEVKAPDRPTEIVNQISSTRQIVAKSKGVIHWSIAGIIKNQKMIDALKNGVYKEKALVPESPWIKSEKPEKPKLSTENSENFINAKWSSSSSQKIFHWVLFTKYNDVWETEILDAEIKLKQIPLKKSGKTLNTIALKAIDRLGNESDYEAVKL